MVLSSLVSIIPFFELERNYGWLSLDIYADYGLYN